MKTKFLGLTFFAFLASVLPFTSFGQDVQNNASITQESVSEHRKFGLSANIQNSELGLSLPIFLTQKFVIAPSFGFTYAEGIGSDISFGLMPKKYFSTDRFAPYMALRLGAVYNRPDGGVSTSEEKNKFDLLGGLAGGAEYFLIPNFSFGVEGQLNMAFPHETSVRFGTQGGIVASLGTAVTANIYFTRK